VTFKIPHQPEFQFNGECKSTGQKNQGDCVIAEAKDKKIPVWNEFLDVFEELRGLPPDRVLEFSTDMIPRKTPISKAQYQMAPTELAILKKQLQEYSDKSLIRLSASPWGAPVLLANKVSGKRLCIEYRELTTSPLRTSTF